MVWGRSQILRCAMFRLTLLLSAAIFLAMMIGGQDRGQLRFGLMQPEAPSRPAPVRQAPQEPELAVKAVAFVPAEPVMVKPAPAPAAPPPPAPPQEAEAARLMYVDATSVNVREGPGKDYAVIGRLSRGEAVELVAAGGDAEGWSLIRIEGDGLQGYVAAQLLAP